MTDHAPEGLRPAVQHLEDALVMMRQGLPHRASWRLADGALLLRRWLEEREENHLAGLDEPTGRGALLPREYDPVREAAPYLLAALENIASVIEGVDRRCMAADGPVTQTLEEMKQSEVSSIYNGAKDAIAKAKGEEAS